MDNNIKPDYEAIAAAMRAEGYGDDITAEYREALDKRTMDVANTIVEQLGGRKFIAMTGARNFLGDANSVSFRLPGGGGFCRDGINFVKITLDPSDTYTMLFLRIRSTRNTVIATHHDVYFDMLQELFTRETGLAVSL